MGDELLLGIDAGTTFCKAAVLTLDGAERSHGRARTPWRTLPDGAEMDPGELFDAALEAAHAAVASGPEGRIVGLGVTSMAETGVLLDAKGDPVGPCIAWHDARGDREAGEITASIGDAEFVGHTGLRVSEMCTLAKYMWMRSSWPDAHRGRRWLNVGEWIVRSLGGKEVAEASLASRTGFLDVASGAWWPDALALSDAPEDLMPEVAGAGTHAGHVGSVLPVAEGAALAVAGHDHLCASVGAGAVAPTDIFDSCGTAEAFVRAVKGPLGPQEMRTSVAGGVTVGRHVLGGKQALLGGVRSGLALQRIRDLLGVSEAHERAELDARALELPHESSGLEVADVTAHRAAITGIGRNVSPGVVWRAAIEAVQERGRAVLDTMQAVGGEWERLIAAGGGLESEAVRIIKREVLGDYERSPVTEAGARGAALIGGVAAGLFEDVAGVPGFRRIKR